tara:strand:+ start:148 stop:906 length:759 start_codon:yes stop_codon:yes gene_type:complete
MKNIIVTGGHGNLGFEICYALNNLGYKVIIIDKKVDKKFFSKKNFINPLNFEIIKADLSSEKELNKIKSKIKSKFKVIDGIINNAAYYENDRGFDNVFSKEKYSSWEKVFRVNLFAPFFLTQKLEKFLKKSNNANIINIGSIYGSIAPDFNLYKNTKMNNPASYNTSKGALVQLTKWMSSALAPNIKTNLISPGGIFRNQNKNFLKKYNLKNPMKRMASEKDVVGIIIFLLSDDAKYINGQNIFVDGGFSNL